MIFSKSIGILVEQSSPEIINNEIFENDIGVYLNKFTGKFNKNIIQNNMNGIVIDNSNFDIKLTHVFKNKDNGIVVTDSTINIIDSIIHKNIGSGVYCTNSKLTVESSEISESGDFEIYHSEDSDIILLNSDVNENNLFVFKRNK